MLDYETLDIIADTYIPALAILSILNLSRSAIARNWGRLSLEVLFLVYAFTLAYGLMFIDNQFALWPTFGLDYSTHTAVAMVLVVFLGLRIKSAWAFWLGSLVGYALLMLYQDYHSISDIITTALALCIFLLPVVFLFISKCSETGQQNNVAPKAKGVRYR